MDQNIVQAPQDLRQESNTLNVQDLQAIMAFHNESLGFRVLHQEADRATLGFETGDPLVIYHAHPRGFERPKSAAGLYHFALLMPGCTQLAQALLRLLDSCYPLQGFAGHFVSETIYLTDPEGNGKEIYAD